MFPIGDDPRTGRGPAYITLGLLALNVVVFLYQVMLGAEGETFIRTFGAVPREILTGQDVAPPGPTPVYLQLLTSMFLHGGWLHLIGNMAYLRVFGEAGRRSRAGYWRARTRASSPSSASSLRERRSRSRHWLPARRRCPTRPASPSSKMR